LAGALPHDSQVSPIKIRGIVFEDVARAEAKVRDSGLHWTILRVLILTDEAARASFRLDNVGKGMEVRMNEYGHLLRNVELDHALWNLVRHRSLNERLHPVATSRPWIEPSER